MFYYEHDDDADDDDNGDNGMELFTPETHWDIDDAMNENQIQ